MAENDDIVPEEQFDNSNDATSPEREADNAPEVSQENAVESSSADEASDAETSETGEIPQVQESAVKSSLDDEQAAQLEEEAQKAVEQHNISHRYRLITVSAIFAIIVIVLVTAFGWPGWARQAASTGSSTATGQDAVVTATPVALPNNASDLEKILPDTVGSYARGEVKTTTVWNDAEPLEQYEVTYTTGDSASEITIVFAQWTSAEFAKTQYDTLIANLKSSVSASGNVKVGDSTTGAYEIHADADNDNNSIIVWQNDTVVFQATGPKNSVNNFYSSFPY